MQIFNPLIQVGGAAEVSKTLKTPETGTHAEMLTVIYPHFYDIVLFRK